MAQQFIIDDVERNQREWPFEPYNTLPTSALQREILPPFHYSNVIVKGEATQRCAWGEIRGIVSCLKAEHWEIINAYPQIGSFLHLTGIGKFKSSVLHAMYLRVCTRVPRKSNYEQWFLVNGKPVRFGIEEFVLVSGMRFGEVSEDDNERIEEQGRLKDQYFPGWGKSVVSVDALKTSIMDLLSRRGSNPEDVCKLIYVWVISSVLMPTRPEKWVDNDTFAICDDLAMCERYPWGDKLWRATFIDIVKNLGTGNEDVALRKWNAYGFPHIFLFWAAEAIEGMADAANFVARVSPTVPRYPRMLRWDFRNPNPSADDMDAFLRNVHAVIPRLRPDSSESATESYKSTIVLRRVTRDSRLPCYKQLGVFLTRQYVVIRDDEGVPEFPNRPSTLADSAPREGAPDSTPVPRRQKRTRISQDGASTSQGQPSSSEVPAWALALEQRLVGRLNDMDQRLGGRMDEMERKISGQINHLTATMENLNRMMIRERGSGDNEGGDNEEGDDEGGDNNDVDDADDADDADAADDNDDDQV